jgi:hypothetical protein
MEIEFGDTIWPRAPRMPNVARWSFKGFRQPDMLSGQEILLRQEKSPPIAKFSARVRYEL